MQSRRGKGHAKGHLTWRILKPDIGQDLEMVCGQNRWCQTCSSLLCSLISTELIWQLVISSFPVARFDTALDRRIELIRTFQFQNLPGERLACLLGQERSAKAPKHQHLIWIANSSTQVLFDIRCFDAFPILPTRKGHVWKTLGSSLQYLKLLFDTPQCVCSFVSGFRDFVALSTSLFEAMKARRLFKSLDDDKTGQISFKEILNHTKERRSKG